MKKILIILMMLLMVTGCSDSGEKQVLFVKNNKKYALCVEGELQSKYIYSAYEKVGTEGYVVHEGKKDSYINNNGKEIIAYKKGVTLKAIEDIIIAKDKDKKYTIYGSDGKALYKSSKNVNIRVDDLPIIHKSKKYMVLNGQGEILTESQHKIIHASLYDSSFITVSYEDSMEIYDLFSETEDDKNVLKIELAGTYDLIDKDDDNGYLLYDNQTKNLAFVDSKGQVQFKTDKDIDSATLYKDTIITKKEDDIFILSTDGSVDVKATSYYQSSQKYLIKNDNYVYGPHQFVNNGKIKEVKEIQLNPAIHKVNGDLFPVYVQSKGYQYYHFSGKAKIKTYFKYAGDFTKDGVAVVSADGKKYYLIDKTGKKLSKKFVKIEMIDDGYFAGYETNTKFVVLNAKGEKIIDDYFMGESEIFVFDEQKFGLFNKSGTTHVYNLNENEEVMTLEGEYKVYQHSYLVSKDYKKYYDMDGEIFYKR